jgi:putative FmdB family regulatory protein
MPIYEYRCDRGHTFEVMQRMTDDPVASCQTCSAPVQRVFHPIAVHFKGSGFYNTDYGTRKRAREKSESSEGAKGAEKGADAKGTSTKSESKSSTADSPAPKPKAAASD